MGTKNNPGKFDCLSKAEPDEPYFILLGRDPAACLAVTFWVKLRLELGQTVDDDQIAEARECARALEVWAASKGKGKQLQKALEAFNRITVSQS